MLNRWKDVFASFDSHGCKYVVIGGIAAVLHGVPRATFDLDILIEASEENCARLLLSLNEVGFGTATMISAKEVLAHEITVFQDRLRIDVQTATPGLKFSDAWEHKIALRFQGQLVYVASRQDLIASKQAAGRPVDLEDIEALRALE